MELTGSHRRRILFVLAGLGGGGAERVMVTLLRSLDRARFELHLALVKAEGPYVRDIPEDVPIHDLQAGRARYATWAIIRLTRRLRPHVVLSTLGYLNLVLIFAKSLMPRGLRLLVREAVTVSAHLAQDIQHPKMWQWLYRRFYKKADKIICLSDEMLNDLAEHFGVPREKMVRIYNPVDVDRIKCLAEARNNPYSGFGPHLVAAGRLSKEKGFDLLLDTMARVRKALPHVQLTILGEGELDSRLKAQRDRLGLANAVHFPGFQSNPFPYFKHADLFVLSSHYEGLPNAVLEALALGTPVVATNGPGGMKEIAQHSSGVRFTALDDPVCFAETVVKALGEGKLTCSRQSSSTFLKTFGVESVTAQYEELLESVTHASSA